MNKVDEWTVRMSDEGPSSTLPCPLCGSRLQEQLATEREKVQELEQLRTLTLERYLTNEQKRIVQQLREQLAAEREKTEAYRDLWHGQQATTSEHLKTILQLRSQLSAAQAFIEQCKNAMTGTGSWRLGDTEHTALDAAIAEAVAEVEEHNIRGAIHPDALAKHIAEAQKPLVDALKNVLFDLGDNWSVVSEKNRRAADAALANVKEGK